MMVHIEETSGNFDVQIGPSETVGDLKNKIEEDEGFQPSRQDLYLKGIFLVDDTVLVEELVREFGDVFTLLLPQAGKRNFSSDEEVGEVFLWIGESRTNFETLRFGSKQQQDFDLKAGKMLSKSDKFGIVTHTKGEEGSQTYTVDSYKVRESKKGTIKLRRGDDGEVKVFLGEDEIELIRNKEKKYTDEEGNTRETNKERGVRHAKEVFFEDY